MMMMIFVEMDVSNLTVQSGVGSPPAKKEDGHSSSGH
jgi:hypothetical protein